MPGHDEIPITRLSRGAMLGGYVAGQTVRYAGTAAANVARSRRAREVALERRHLDAAEQMLSVLGTMKGPAMKLGQLLSVLDLSFLPADVRPRFQERLAALCEDAPEISWKRMEPVLTRALGGPISSTLRELDTTPIGTASIGQVYRGVTVAGVEVAIKVQYPQIVAAARADLKNMSALMKMGSSLAPSIDMEALAAEVSTRFLEELDYAREAENTAVVAAAYDGHPFIRVPRPMRELCGPSILVTEYISGVDFAGMRRGNDAERGRNGEVIARFFLGSMFRNGIFSGDPHPGNLRMTPEGHLAFFDFGSTKTLDPTNLDLARSALEAAGDGNGEAIRATLGEHGVLANPEAITGDHLVELFQDIMGWVLTDEVVEMHPSIASDAIIASMSPRGDYQAILSDQDLPVEWALVMRTLFMTSALLGQLGASANWRRIGSEWITGAEPQTELGLLEAEWLKGRSGAS